MKYYDVVIESLEEMQEKLPSILKLYDFSITLSEIKAKMPTTIEKLVFKDKYTGYHNYPIGLVPVEYIFTNKRNTLKIVILGDKSILILPREGRVGDLPLFEHLYDREIIEIFENIQEGMWIAFVQTYNTTWYLACLTDAISKDQAEKWITLYEKAQTERQMFNEFREMRELKRLNIKTTATIEALEKEVAAVQAIAKNIKTLEVLEKKKKNKAITEQISTKIEGETNTLTLKALDEHTYSIEIPSSKSFDIQAWIPFVYIHRYYWSKEQQKAVKEQTLFSDFMSNATNLASEVPLKISVDNKTPVKLEFKQSSGKAILTYLNDKIIAKSDMETVLQKYFMKGESLVEPEQDESKKEELLSLRKEREQEITSEGIKGFIEDLEGEFPINIAFEKDGAKWNLVIGEKHIHLKGGIETIKSLERVLKGTALGYDSRHKTEELFKRLSSVLGEEEALEIISEAKAMGKLVKALGGKNNE